MKEAKDIEEEILSERLGIFDARPYAGHELCCAGAPRQEGSTPFGCPQGKRDEYLRCRESKNRTLPGSRLKRFR